MLCRRKEVNNMAYQPYVSPEYYQNTYRGENIPEDRLEKCLREASRHIDSLTYNRIIGRGISSLTEFQRETVQEVVCKQADFEYQNSEIFDMILQGYSINGVSMQFGESWNVKVEKGIPVRKDVYEQLCQTGLCCRILR